VTTLPSDTTPPSFIGDWESGNVTGAGSWGYRQTIAADRFRLLNDGGARQGSYYARVEVRPGDDPLNCHCGTERSEVLDMGGIDEDEQSGTVRYAFSVKFDPSWQAPVSTGGGAWGIFLQLHGPDSMHTNPAFALNATDKIQLSLRTGDVDAVGLLAFQLTNNALNKGKWIDFILTIKYAKYATGYVILERRDEGQASYAEVLNVQNVATLQYSSSITSGAVLGHYMKHGLYRNANTFTSILYVDGFTRTVVH
jgi:hypothetical protein